MTTVCVDRFQKQMAADYMLVDEGRKIGGGKKISVYPGYLLATAGDIRACQDFERYWVANNHQAQFKGKGVYALILFKDGTLQTYDGSALYEVKDRYFAIGSGGDYALGALHAGADVEYAVRIASQLDSSTGMGVQLEQFSV